MNSELMLLSLIIRFIHIYVINFKKLGATAARNMQEFNSASVVSNQSVITLIVLYSFPVTWVSKYDRIPDFDRLESIQVLEMGR